MRKIRVFSGGAMPVTSRWITGRRKDSSTGIARDDEKRSSMFKKLLRAKDSTIVKRVRRQTDRARAGADCEGGAV